MQNLTVSELLRKMVEAELSVSLKREFDSPQFEMVRTDIRSLRECLAIVAEVLLVTAGKLKREQATSWVDREIRR